MADGMRGLFPEVDPDTPLGRMLAGRSGMDENQFLRAIAATPGYGAPVRSELASRSDRLRPPYRTPVAQADPIHAGAARMLEVGYNRLPTAYQRAYAQSAPPQSLLPVGTFPEGLSHRGVLSTARDTGRAQMYGADPASMTHELVHELGRRTQQPWDQRTEEALAQLVAGEEGTALDPAYRARAASIDAGIRDYYGDPTGPVSAFWQWLTGTPAAVDATEGLAANQRYRRQAAP